MKQRLKKQTNIVEKIAETKSWFFKRKIKLIRTFNQTHQVKKRTQIKSEMKKEKLQLTPQKYIVSQEITMLIKWTNQKKWIFPRKVHSLKLEIGRNRKYECINYQ